MSNNKLILRSVNSPWVTPFNDITTNSVLSWADVDNNFIYLKGEVIYSGQTSGTNLILNKINGNDISIDLTQFEAEGNRWHIPSGATVEIATDYQSFIFGDLYIEGLLKLNDGAQLVVLNGDIILSGGSISGNGTTLLVDLPFFDTVVTGGTYSNGTATFGNNIGGTFNVNGFYTGSTEIFITGGTYNQSNGIATFTNNTGGTFNVDGFLTGYTNYYTTGATLINNIAYFDRSDTLSAYTLDLSSIEFTGNTSGDCIGDLWVSNVHGCSPITIHDSIQFNNSTASGILSTAFGTGTTASGLYSHAEGNRTTASGIYSHAEGGNTIASGNTSHAEGRGTTASGNYSHSEGLSTKASGNTSHAEGESTTAIGSGSHSEGYYTIASDFSSHAEGSGTRAIGYVSHAEGNYTTASGAVSHTEGEFTIASGIYSHAEGYYATATNTASHAEGRQTKASGDYSHAEGYLTTSIGRSSHGEGEGTIASGVVSHAEGQGSVASGNTAHAEGYYSTAGGDITHAEGWGTIATGYASHSEGRQTKASGIYSHAEGYLTTASGDYSHTEGYLTTSIGKSSHAGGTSSSAIGVNSFIHSANSLVTGDRSVVLGGQNITGATADTVYVPNLNIDTTPTNDNSLTDVLVRANDGEVKYRTIPLGTSYGLFAQTALSTPITNTIVESPLVGTGVGTLSVPANAFQVGDSFTGKMCGNLSCRNNETIHIRIKSGVNIIGDLGVFTMNTATNKFFELFIDFTITKIGGAGVAELFVNGQYSYNQDTAGVLRGSNFALISNTTFDTTVLNTLTITAEWGAANVANSIQSQNFVLTKTF